MGYSYNQYVGNGVTTDYAVVFPYLEPSHVEVSVNSLSVAFTWVNPGTVRVASPPAVGIPVVVRRNSGRSARIVDFVDGVVLAEGDLDRDSNQLMYVAQEALDQASTQSYFQTDAEGARVVNVADPIGDQDAATKAWVTGYVTSVAGAGSDIRPLDNTGASAFTGNNEFTKPLKIMGATFDGVGVSLSDTLDLDKALYVRNITNNPVYLGYGYTAVVQRTTGLPSLVGGQFNSQLLGTLNGPNWGIATEAWKGKTALGTAVGGEHSVINLNAGCDDPYSLRVGADLVFKNREDGAVQGGNAVGSLGVAGDGTGANLYNVKSWALQFSSQGRSDSGATYVGWNRGLLLRDNWCDLAKVLAFDITKNYYPGDYVTYVAHVFECKEFTNGNSPVVSPGLSTYWADLGVGSERKAIAIDLSGVGAVTASRMLAGMKLRGSMPILWDTEEHISTLFDFPTERWALKNDTTERFGINIVTGDLYLNGGNSLLATPSIFSAHRNSAPQVMGGGFWQLVYCTTAEFNPRGEFNTGTGLFTAGIAGYYDVIAQIQTEASAPAGQSLYVGLSVNGAGPAASKAANVNTAAGINTVRVHTKVHLNAGDTLAPQMFCAAAINLSGLPSATFFQASKIA